MAGLKLCQESKWAKSENGPRVKMGYCCLPPERVELTVNSKKKQMTRSKWAKSQNESRVKMVCCCLHPERVEQQCTERKKQMAESKWAKSQDGLLFFTLRKSRTNSKQQERNKWQGQNCAKSQNGPRVKIGQG